jgi:hypothetical protein
MRFEALKVGELARRTGLTARPLHHYDAMGLLRPSLHTEAGYRLYTDTSTMREAMPQQRRIGLRRSGLVVCRACLTARGCKSFCPLLCGYMERLSLRTEDLDFGPGAVTIGDGKVQNYRVTMLPGVQPPPLEVTASGEYHLVTQSVTR